MKPIIMLFCFVLFLSCRKESDTPQNDIVESPIDTAKELAAIEAFRQHFQLAIKEKRYQDLGPIKRMI